MSFAIPQSFAKLLLKTSEKPYFILCAGISGMEENHVAKGLIA